MLDQSFRDDNGFGHFLVAPYHKWSRCYTYAPGPLDYIPDFDVRPGAHGGPAAILACAGTIRFAGPMRARSTNRFGACRRGRQDWWAGHAPRRRRPRSAHPSCLRRVVCPYAWPPRLVRRVRVGAHGGLAAILACAGTIRFAGPMRAQLTNRFAAGRRGRQDWWAGHAPRRRRHRSAHPSCLRRVVCPYAWPPRSVRRVRVGAHGGLAAILACAGTIRFAGPLRARLTNRFGAGRRGRQDWWAGHAPRRRRPRSAHPSCHRRVVCPYAWPPRLGVQCCDRHAAR